MKLNNVSVAKYRSINDMANFETSNFTVLVGPNNHGKSNLLRATVLAMEVIEGVANSTETVMGGEEVSIYNVLKNNKRLLLHRRSPERPGENVGYDWSTDYPVFARGNNIRKKSTRIRLRFYLDESERHEFCRETGISTNSDLTVEVELTKNSVSLAIRKQGRGDHKNKAVEIAKFITSRVKLLYIPSVRTNNSAILVSEEILKLKRAEFEKTPEYADAVQKVDELENKITTEVEGMVKTALNRFIPQVSSVSINTLNRVIRFRNGDIRSIYLNDGTDTEISSKGSGVQSLVALALILEWANEINHEERQLILAVDEPETHLHAGAIRELKQILSEISESQQVIVTTHSQTLINRNNLGSNVIVENRTAHSAKNIEELRHILGVQLSDSLSLLEVIIFCEGESDKRIISEYLKNRNKKFETWTSEGRLEVEVANGGSKIIRRVQSAAHIMTHPIVFLDSDEAGRKDIKHLLEENLIEQRDIITISTAEKKSAELEDTVSLQYCIDKIEDELGFNLTSREKRVLDNGTKPAWSDRFEKILKDRGTPDTKHQLLKCKKIVVDAFVDNYHKNPDVMKEEFSPIFERLEARVSAYLAK